MTTSPVGRCVMRTAESVVFTPCPPWPAARYTSIFRSSSRISRSTSSASGSTATVAVDVWIRPCASVAGPRDRLRRLDELLAREVAQVRVTAVGELFGLALLALGLAQRSHRPDDRPQVRELLAHAADARGIGGRGRIGHQPAELVVPLLDLREPSAQAGRERAVAVHAASASASRSPASASPSDPPPTPILPASRPRAPGGWSPHPRA